MKNIYRSPGRFPNLEAIYYQCWPLLVEYPAYLQFAAMLNLFGTQSLDNEGRKIDIHVKVKTDDFVGFGRDFRWFSLVWKLP